MSKEYLDRKEVERIIYNLERDICDCTTINLTDIATKWNDNLDKAITQICQLKPKNQVVIAEGEVKCETDSYFDRYYIKDIMVNGDGFWAGYKNKKVKIILEEI